MRVNGVTTHTRTIVALSLTCGCSPVEFRSPAEGDVIQVPWVPVVIHAPARFATGTAEVELDGAPLPDPLQLIRAQKTTEKGSDLLATLNVTALAPGPHRLSVRWTTADGEIASAEAGFVVERRAARVRFEVVDGEGRPASARVLIRTAEGPVELSGRAPDAADPSGRFASFSSVFVTDGAGIVDLDPGQYTFVATRGLRDDVDVQTLDIAQSTTVRLSVPRVVDTPDDVLADLHVHTGRSRDAFVPDDVRFRSLVAAGIDVAVITDHDLVTDDAPRIRRVVADGDAIRLVAGVEVTIGEVTESDGHFNTFPVAPADLPEPPATPGVTAYLDLYSPLPGAPLLQLNHPRGIQFSMAEPLDTEAHALFTRFGFDPDQPLTSAANTWLIEATPETGTRALDFDAIEVANRFSRAGYMAVRADWFALLNQGWFLTGTGNSDSHALEVERAGFPDNLVRIAPPAAGEGLDAGAFVEAIRAGHVTVSNGPVIDLSVEAASGESGAPGDLVGGAGFVASVRVRAAPWVPCPAVRLIVNGELVVERALSDRAGEVLLDETYRWPLSFAADAWVVAEAGTPLAALERDLPTAQPAPWRWILPEYEPMAFTNPVRVDADGDGTFTPPGLER